MSQSSPSTYKYHLLLEPDSIRILQLQPSLELTSTLQCELITTRLCDNTEPSNRYAAVSYVWGDEIDSHSISIGSHTVSVGRNIHSALCHIRRRDRAIRLWVDAICIDQSSVTERNHQVQQMRTIYSAAQETIIYLGDQDGGNTGLSAWNFLERNSAWAMNEDHEIDYSIPAALKEQVHFRGDLDDVEIDVLRRPWFRRVWVFQEVVVSMNVSIQCGSRKIAWNELCRILLLNPRYHDRYGFSISRAGCIDPVRDIFLSRCSYQSAHGLENLLPSWYPQVKISHAADSHILNTLSRARQLESSDPRDKIYALLGVSSGIDLSDKLITVDYRKPWAQVYTDFARCDMEQSRSYDLLSFLDSFSPEKTFGSRSPEEGLLGHLELMGNPQTYPLPDFSAESPSSLPSWVPNWNRSGWHSASSLNSLYTGPTVLSTLCPETDVRKQQRELLTTRSRTWSQAGVLSAVGLIIGHILETNDPIALLGRNEHAFQDIRNRHYHDPKKMNRKIMALWEDIIEPYLWQPNIPRELPAFRRLLSYKANESRNSVEHHLLSRARKTVAWSDDHNKAVVVIKDNSSIVDTKRVAVYQRLDENRKVIAEGLALLPNGTGTLFRPARDLLVYLRGARVPFIVRLESIRSEVLVDEESIRRELKSDFEFENCTIMGECLVNGFDEFVEEAEAELGKAETELEASISQDTGHLPLALFSNGRIFVMS